MQVYDGSKYINYTYGSGAGPHAVTSTFVSDYFYQGFNVTSSCFGVVPGAGGNWNISAPTNCSGGKVRLSENQQIQVAPGNRLILNNVTLDAAGVAPGGYLQLGAGSTLEGGPGTLIFGDDVQTGIANFSTNVSYKYDAAGNMVNDSRFTFIYNDDNRMWRVYNGSSLVEEYLYDHGGSRKVKLTVFNASLNRTTYYISQAWIRDVFTNGTVTDILNIYANNELLARNGSAGNKHFYHPDHLGSTTVVTNATGQVEDRISYEPWGTPRQQSKELLQYTNQEWVPQLGFYDYDARQYNPQLKRFMQADTIIPNSYNPQNLNRYAYVRNNPFMYIDVSGHVPNQLQTVNKVEVVDYYKALELNCPRCSYSELLTIGTGLLYLQQGYSGSGNMYVHTNQGYMDVMHLSGNAAASLLGNDKLAEQLSAYFEKFQGKFPKGTATWASSDSYEDPASNKLGREFANYVRKNINSGKSLSKLLDEFLSSNEATNENPSNNPGFASLPLTDLADGSQDKTTNPNRPSYPQDYLDLLARDKQYGTCSIYHPYYLGGIRVINTNPSEPKEDANNGKK